MERRSFHKRLAEGSIPLAAIMNIYRCQKCGSSYTTRGDFSVTIESFLDVKPPIPTCKKCDAKLPWLGYRDYGVVRNRSANSPGAYGQDFKRTPLWMIPGR